ncbi:MAG: lipoate--protein ligase family protein, partial [Cyanobacteria bacterium J06649_4]
FLIEGWRTLGIELTFGGAGSYIKNPNCFGSATSADLVMENGYKLIGSAQVYRDSCVLQHGSIRLRPDPALFYQVFGDALETPQLPESCLSEDGVGNVMEALTTAASRCFDASFQPCPLSSSEQTEISTDYKTRFEPLSV